LLKVHFHTNSSPVGHTFDIQDFFSNYTSFLVDPAFNLSSHLHVTGLSSTDFMTVTLGESSVEIGQAVNAIPEPGALLLLIAGAGAMITVRRRSQKS
jgi:hypothetical protein